MDKDKIADKLVELAGEIRKEEVEPPTVPGIYVYYPYTGNIHLMMITNEHVRIELGSVPMSSNLWRWLPGLNDKQYKKVKLMEIE